jgi:hypothetical protein
MKLELEVAYGKEDTSILLLYFQNKYETLKLYNILEKCDLQIVLFHLEQPQIISIGIEINQQYPTNLYLFKQKVLKNIPEILHSTFKSKFIAIEIFYFHLQNIPFENKELIFKNYLKLYHQNSNLLYQQKSNILSILEDIFTSIDSRTTIYPVFAKFISDKFVDIGNMTKAEQYIDIYHGQLLDAIFEQFE